ncbi:hypothetical protein KAK07_02805 [Ideonella sp. 4Y16]|uniref:hypothetical protein n=1 Tax=Ideonella alba TaxID=2824118 RepID=UPI001B394DC7|nr:hypothetical protein [Ideonella alba]MBQ0942260.1 hypothetical protein [Ideonella alba]
MSAAPAVRTGLLTANRLGRQFLMGGLLALGAASLPAAESGRFATASLEAAVRELERQLQPQQACQQGLDAVAQHRAEPDEALEQLCRTALAGLRGQEASALSARYRRLVRGDFSAQLWAAAALQGDPRAWLGLASQFEAEAGAADHERSTAEADLLAAAQAATQRAVARGVPGANDLLERLQAQEFPLQGARLEPLWRAIYFRQYERITDSIDTRRHVAGFTLGVIDICERWEVGVRSVNFDAALETYLAPVRSQVPERMMQAVPRLGRTVAAAASQARQGAGDRSAAGWIEQGLRAVQAARKEVRQAVAIGSSDGRNAGQQLFNSVSSCRSPRGLRMLDALARYFRHMQGRSPLPPRHAASGTNTPSFAHRKD